MDRIIILWLVIIIILVHIPAYADNISDGQKDRLSENHALSAISITSVSAFHDANYDTYNSYASENGLKGDRLHLYGSIRTIGKTRTGFPYFILEQEDNRQWVVASGITYDISHLLNQSVEVFCVYGGFSDAYHLPAVHIEEHGCIYDVMNELYYFSEDAENVMNQDGFVLNSSEDIDNQDAVSSSEYNIFKMNYSLPSTWITETAKNGYYHYAKESGNSDGGYLFIAGDKTDSDLAKNLNDETTYAYFDNYFKGVFSTEDDLQFITYNKNGYWTAYCSGGGKHGLYLNCWYIIGHEYSYGCIYTNTSVGRSDQDNEFFEILSSFHLEQEDETTSKLQLSEDKTEENKEIQFRNTPWGISFTEAEKLFPEYDLYGMTGEVMKFYPTMEIYTGSYDWNHSPEYHDINIIGACWNDEFDVAGYRTSNIELYFAYTLVDGIITHEESDSKMYGARYKFEPADAQSMIEDMKTKLSSLYGDIDEDGKDDGFVWDYTWWIWKGANNTAVALTLEDDKDSERDEVWVSYFNYDGDKWLFEASDGEKERLLRQERAGAESGNTDGL